MPDSIVKRNVLARPAMLILALLPPVYLCLTPISQFFLLGYCFDTQLHSLTIAIILLSSAIFSVAYVLGLRAKPESVRNQIPGSVITTLATILLLAATAYVLVAVYRIYSNWDAFSQGPALSRIIIAGTRRGISLVGIFYSIFLGAPAVFVIFVTAYCSRLSYKTMFKTLSVLVLGVMIFLMSFEGGRFASALTLASVLSTIILICIRERRVPEEFGAVYLTSLALISFFAMYFAYSETLRRETAMGRTDSASVIANYGGYVSQSNERQSAPIKSPAAKENAPSGNLFERAPNEGLESKQTLPLQSPTKSLSSSQAIACFYYSHPVRSVDRIIEKGASKNLFGFYMMPNYYKLLLVAGLAHEPWLSYSDFYGVTGLYSAFVGVALIDFSWWGLIVVAAFGYASGSLVRIATSKNGLKSPVILLASVVPSFILALPIVDIVSSAQMQSMMPWLALVVVTLYFYAVPRGGKLML